MIDVEQEYYLDVRNRYSRLFTVNDKQYSLAEIVRFFGINRKTFTCRIDRGWTAERAATTPAYKCNKVDKINGIKICPSCDTPKTIQDYYRNTNICKRCSIKKTREWEQSNVERYQKQATIRNYRRKFGLEMDVVYKILDQQDNKCANPACKLPITIGRITLTTKGFERKSAAQLDHDHITGRIRGFLCLNCNVSLGNAKDSPDILSGLLAYMTDRTLQYDDEKND